MALRIVRKGNAKVNNDHNLLYNRGLPGQHPIESISGLREELNEKYVKPGAGIPKGDLGFPVATMEDIDALNQDVTNRIIIVDSNLATIEVRVESVEDFLSHMYEGKESGVADEATINFAYRSGFREEFITEDGDREFHLINKFVPDGKHLKVYRDGELMTPGIDYEELSDNKVWFKYGLDSGMYMTFICETMSTVISPVHEEVISIEGQTEFTLKNTYRLGDHSLSLYVKGLRLEQGTDYEEVNSDTISLLGQPYPAGTKLIFRQEGLQSAGQVLYHEKDYQQKTWKLDFVATQGQTIFNLSESYIPGTSMITVSINGLLMWPGEHFDYIELNDKAVQFNYPLDQGEKVSVVCIAAIYNWCERFVALKDQQVFELSNIYYTGRNDVVVFENGMQLSVGDDYEEASNKAIRLLEAPPIGSKITIYKRR